MIVGDINYASGLHSHWHFYKLIRLMRNAQRLYLCVLWATCHCQVDTHLSSASSSYTTRCETVAPFHKPGVIRNPMVLSCLYQRVSTYWLICFTSSPSMLLMTKRNLDGFFVFVFTEPDFNHTQLFLLLKGIL
jgi:hypothetical protein